MCYASVLAFAVSAGFADFRNLVVCGGFNGLDLSAVRFEFATSGLPAGASAGSLGVHYTWDLGVTRWQELRG